MGILIKNLKISFMKNMKHALLWVGIYAIGMAFLESAVVVYLRNMFYPDGFTFPIVQLNSQIAITEVLREVATVLMLVSVGVLVTKKASERFAYFIYAFAIWDIFYYIFLYFLMGWPQSLLDWDILFLIPVTWFGPVISPVLIAFMMIVLAVSIIYFNQKFDKVKISAIEWGLFTSGSVIVILSWIWDTVLYVINHFSFSKLADIKLGELIKSFSLDYVPEHFPWLIYFFGFSFIVTGIVHFFRRHLRIVNSWRK